MSRRMPSDPARLREEIAQAAARMIAEDGADYATAKRKAARQVLGDIRVALIARPHQRGRAVDVHRIRIRGRARHAHSRAA